MERINTDSTVGTRMINDENRVIGPLVLVLYPSRTEKQFSVAPDRRESALVTNTMNPVDLAIYIWSRFSHQNVNYYLDLVDPSISARTQDAERT